MRAKHTSVRYAAPVFKAAPPEVILVEFANSRFGLSRRAETDGFLELRDSGQVEIEELARNFEPIRRELAGKRLRGVPLSSQEERCLQLINTALRSLSVPPKPEPELVRLALDEGERLLAEFKRANASAR